MSYNAFILLPSVASVSPEGVLNRIQDFYRALCREGQPPARFENRHGEVTLIIEGWSLRVILDHGEHVIEEAAEIVEDLEAGRLTASEPRLLDQAKAIGLGSYTARLDISSDDDPNMDYFNDYIFVIEALNAIPGAVAFDHRHGMLM
jgi:hypothetical protein